MWNLKRNNTDELIWKTERDLTETNTFFFVLIRCVRDCGLLLATLPPWSPYIAVTGPIKRALSCLSRHSSVLMGQALQPSQRMDCEHARQLVRVLSLLSCVLRTSDRNEGELFLSFWGINSSPAASELNPKVLEILLAVQWDCTVSNETVSPQTTKVMTEFLLLSIPKDKPLHLPK